MKGYGSNIKLENIWLALEKDSLSNAMEKKSVRFQENLFCVSEAAENMMWIHT